MFNGAGPHCRKALIKALFSMTYKTGGKPAENQRHSVGTPVKDSAIF